MELDELTARLIDRYQHGMPLCAEPYLEAGPDARLQRARAAGLPATPGTGGRAVAGRAGVRSQPRRRQYPNPGGARRAPGAGGGAHQPPPRSIITTREHHYNLWFVLTGPNRRHLEQILEELEKDTGLIPGPAHAHLLSHRPGFCLESIRDRPLNHEQLLDLRRCLERGLPRVSRPYENLAEQIGAHHLQVLRQMQRWRSRACSVGSAWC